MQAVILAGGLATRMYPRTLKIPKALLPLAGRPFADWQLELLYAKGFRDIIYCVAHLADQIIEHVGNGSQFGLSVRYAHEGDKLLGTAGAIVKALPMLHDQFLVTYGDSYLPFDYGALLRLLSAHSDADGVMSVFENHGAWDSSNTIADSDWILSYKKGVKDSRYSYIDYGALAFRKSVFSSLALAKDEVFQLDRVQTSLSEAHRMRAFHVNERFYEVGSEAGLQDLENTIRSLHKRMQNS